MSSVNLWDEVLAKVEGKVNRHSFATWFRPTNYLALQGSSLLIGDPNAQFKDWLTKNYQSVLTEALVDLGHNDVHVVFEEAAETTAAAPPPGSERTVSYLNAKY